MNSEIIAIGTEIVLGDLVDTNTAHIARKLRSIGLDVLYTSAVGDNEDRITDVIRYALKRSQVVITSGGLGPTVDDMTRAAVARATDHQLIFDESLHEQIRARFARMNRQMTENNKLQAWRPEGSTPIENPVGTAPSFVVDTGESVIISLPGVPREMEYLLEDAVLPYLRRRFNLNSLIKVRVLHVVGLGESVVDQHVGDLEKLSNPMVGLNAHYGIVDIRIAAKAGSEAEADTLIANVEKTARERLNDSIFGADDETLEGVVMAKLIERGHQVAVIESGTLGRIAGKLAQADGGRGAFRGGEIKLLDGSADLKVLARSVAEVSGATCGLACVASAQDKVLEIGVGVWRAGEAKHWQMKFGGHPALIPDWAATMALNALRRSLMKDG
ncbi:MAG: CinA family nicotinamide mononucleotide deamidase-related protein [Chloroflexi bacterium]|nr:CinA family nicotinamide mononucleotide deamidase-related protein [Chloroflexota bacterium]